MQVVAHLGKVKAAHSVHFARASEGTKRDVLTLVKARLCISRAGFANFKGLLECSAALPRRLLNSVAQSLGSVHSVHLCRVFRPFQSIVIFQILNHLKLLLPGIVPSSIPRCVSEITHLSKCKL